MSEHPRFGARLDLAGSIDIRALDIDAIGDVRTLQITAFEKLCAPYASESEAGLVLSVLSGAKHSEELVRSAKRGKLVGAFVENRLTGVVTWSHSRDDRYTQRLRSVFVDPMFARSDIGRTLVRHVEGVALAAGAHDMSVRSFIQSTGFFERLGYTATSFGALTLAPDVAMAVSFLRKSLDQGAKAAPLVH